MKPGLLKALSSGNMPAWVLSGASNDAPRYACGHASLGSGSEQGSAQSVSERPVEMLKKASSNVLCLQIVFSISGIALGKFGLYVLSALLWSIGGNSELEKPSTSNSSPSLNAQNTTCIAEGSGPAWQKTARTGTMPTEYSLHRLRHAFLQQYLLDKLCKKTACERWAS